MPRGGFLFTIKPNMQTMEKEPESYNYNFPAELIAKKPASPRDAARLFVYNRQTGEIFHDSFLSLGKYLPKDSLLVFNETRVIPARIPLYKESGGKVEALYISSSNNLKIIANKKLELGQKLFLKLNSPRYFWVEKLEDKFYYLKPNFPVKNYISVFQKHGVTPLPPYMKDSPLRESQRRKAYQTVFAKKGESVAAPTASLHFTKRLLKSLKKAKVETAFVRLDVSLGTFAPLTRENLKSGKLHEEKYFIDETTAAKVKKAKKAGGHVIAVGTTVTRALEAWGKTKKLSGSTSLFIYPGYKFKIVDGLVTNFHVPKSSLIMLVSSLTGREELLSLYNLAVKNKYKLFSFGDGMLIL